VSVVENASLVVEGAFSVGADLLHPVAEFADGDAVQFKKLAADVLASETSALHAGPDPLDNQVPVE
jgi:hypothetical protein